jgi:hypothetical protein
MVGEIVYPFETLPDPMDVVWSFFPYDEQRGVPASEPHPALVFETYEFRDGEYAVKVAYGTSAAARRDGPHFVVSNYNALMFAGLNKVTTFDLGRAKFLPWTSRWFSSPDPTKYATPKIGCIQADGQEVLRSILRERRDAGQRVP